MYVHSKIVFEILIYSDYVTFTAGVIRCLIMFEPKYVIIRKRMLHNV